MQPRALKVERLGRVEYGAGLELQKQTERAVLTGEQPDTLLLLEHPHTLTLGRRATEGAIIAPDEVLRSRGVTVFETNRGGKVTYHGLGQIVGYPIVNLSPHREDVHRFVRDLEEVLMRTLRDFDDCFTAPLHGFAGAEDYWRRASAKPHLDTIRVPALLLNARNDPLIPHESLPRPHEVGPHVTLWQPREGGHVGFVAGRWPGHVRAMPDAVCDWLAQAG